MRAYRGVSCAHVGVVRACRSWYVRAMASVHIKRCRACKGVVRDSCVCVCVCVSVKALATLWPKQDKTSQKAFHVRQRRAGEPQTV